MPIVSKLAPAAKLLCWCCSLVGMILDWEKFEGKSINKNFSHYRDGWF